MLSRSTTTLLLHLNRSMSLDKNLLSVLKLKPLILTYIVHIYSSIGVAQQVYQINKYILYPYRPIGTTWLSLWYNTNYCPFQTVVAG